MQERNKSLCQTAMVSPSHNRIVRVGETANEAMHQMAMDSPPQNKKEKIQGGAKD